MRRGSRGGRRQLIRRLAPEILYIVMSIIQKSLGYKDGGL